MININGTSWEELTEKDVKAVLDSEEKESFFFEFKRDDETPGKLVKEISAFANTYGGYVFIGINDDKTIGGCTEWTELRIHTTVHDSLTPVPVFNVKQLTIDDKVVLILRIEEGTMPPYITNTGHIYERVSSGSFPIKESSKLMQLYHKREDQIEKTRNKIELPPMCIDDSLPVNLCAYVDLGFSMTFSETPYFGEHFYDFDLTQVRELAANQDNFYHISRVGYSYVITAGDCKPEQEMRGSSIVRLGNGVNDFIEIMSDGSVRARALIQGSDTDNSADIVALRVFSAFKKFYKLFFQNDLPEKFISAQKYQKLTVVKQFVANSNSLMEVGDNYFKEIYSNHVDQFGEPRIVDGNRIPATDFETIDQRSIELAGSDFNMDILVDYLFDSVYAYLGYTT